MRPNDCLFCYTFVKVVKRNYFGWSDVKLILKMANLICSVFKCLFFLHFLDFRKTVLITVFKFLELALYSFKNSIKS